MHAIDFADTPLVRSVEAWLGAGGMLSQHLPGFEPRAPQLELARLWARALELGRTAAAEAGTGTGKSIGYLIPSLLWALEKGRTVVVSTASRPLQDQLMQDLERLRPLFENRFRHTKMMGLRNYACERKLAEGVDLLGLDDELEQLTEWLGRTQTGELVELPFDIETEPYSQLRQAVTVTDDDCPRRKRCPHGEECWFFYARDRATEASIIVVNHALLCAHLRYGSLLPSFDALVLDEAHKLEDAARGALEGLLSPSRFKRLCRVIGLAGLEGTELFKKRAGHLLNTLAHVPHQRRFVSLTEFERQPVEKACRLLYQLAGKMAESAEDDGTPWPEIAAEQLAELQNDLRGLVGRDKQGKLDPGAVAWVERERGKSFARVMPTKVDGWLQRNLFAGRPVLLTSATLTTSRDERAWDYARNTQGWNSSLVRQLDSPFDWRKQVIYYIPPTPRDLHLRERNGRAKYNAEFKARIYLPHLRDILMVTRGRAFLLFTSFEVLNAVWAELQKADLPWPILAQGQMSKQATELWFKSTPNPVLLATKTYWEGINVPGPQLSCVVIDQLPFCSPDDPLEQALAYGLTPKEAQKERHIPHATVELKQGFGRLIRLTTDRGLAVCLDSRLRFASYGPSVLEALPGNPTLRNLLPQSALPGVTRWLDQVAA